MKLSNSTPVSGRLAGVFSSFAVAATWTLAMVAAVFATAASGSTISFTNRAAFEASLPTGYFLENFTSLATGTYSSVSGSGGTPVMNYTISSSPGAVYVAMPGRIKLVGNFDWTDALFTAASSTAGVHSLGAQFWLSDTFNNRLAGTVNIQFSNGSSMAVPSTTIGALGFAGITSSTPLTSMTVLSSGIPDVFVNMSNLYIATVPEPSTYCMALVGLACGGFSMWRQKTRRQS